MTKPNREYQDSFFHTLFGSKENAIELFNALENSNYSMDTNLEFTTLENVFYHGIKNDLGFVIDSNRFVMICEHQSTINENMPTRLLEYMGRTFEKILDRHKLYQKRKVFIPNPIFYILYTGTEPWNVKELKLSDSYLERTKEFNLELIVKVVDLNYNRDSEVLYRSEKLKGYSLLLHYIREVLDMDVDLKAAIDIAVKRCIREGVLKDFLLSHAEEVGSMLYYDISDAEYWKVRYEEGIEDGMERGRELGISEGRELGISEGREQGSYEVYGKFIERCRKMGDSNELIIEKLIEMFELSEEDAMEYIKIGRLK